MRRTHLRIDSYPAIRFNSVVAALFICLEATNVVNLENGVAYSLSRALAGKLAGRHLYKYRPSL